MYDLLKASEGLIGHGTGIVNVNGPLPGSTPRCCRSKADPNYPVEFRLVVFRPFKGEVILGKISSSSLQGIKSNPPNLHTHEHFSY